VVEPFGAHPSYTQGYYDRDNAFYLEWETISKDAASVARWLDEWVHGVTGRSEYVDKLGSDRIDALRPEPALSEPVDYGSYT
jgi:glutaconate CoA-transferase subunit A